MGVWVVREKKNVAVPLPLAVYAVTFLNVCCCERRGCVCGVHERGIKITSIDYQGIQQKMQISHIHTTKQMVLHGMHSHMFTGHLTFKMYHLVLTHTSFRRRSSSLARALARSLSLSSYRAHEDITSHPETYVQHILLGNTSLYFSQTKYISM